MGWWDVKKKEKVLVLGCFGCCWCCRY